MGDGQLQAREHSIQADLNRLKEARDFGGACRRGVRPRPREARYDVKLAMSEAVTNAIQHGSSSADSTRSGSTSAAEGGALVFEVVDTGRFVPRVTRRGELPEFGRGLEFMRVLMDEVDLQPGLDGTRRGWCDCNRGPLGEVAKPTRPGVGR